VTSEELCLLLERSVRGVGTEDAIQRAIAQVLRKERPLVAFAREVRLDKASRIDFMVGTIGVEVKVGGGISAVIRQLHRYAEFATVAELVLVSTKTSLARVPTELNGKRVRVALLLGGIF
jgi:hypothetical protein